MLSIAVGLLLVGWVGTAVAGEEEKPWIESVKAEQYSSTGKILVEQYMYREAGNRGYHHEIWLVCAADASKRKLLYTHERVAEVVFSPDDKWLFINNRFASNEANLVLFRQKKGIEYEEIKTDVAGDAWDFLAKQEKETPFLDHSYAEALRWTDDRTVLVCLRGHLDSKNYVQDWLCLYDVNTKTFSTDLDAHNKRHVVVEPGRTSL